MFEDKRRLTIQPFFAWYDFWIGAYYDRTFDVLYICPIPCFGVQVYFAGEKTINRRRATDEKEEDL
jgi:hypothetical protein